MKITRRRCDGSCEEHRGEVRPVECWDPGDSEPWRFNYCDEAVEEDRRRGFRVVEANITKQPNTDENQARTEAK